jgi:hypothetical protein
MSLTKVSYSMINGAAINALDYGVVGDGVTADGPAMQLAFTAAAGKTLVIPAGSYSLGSTALTLPAGVTVIAYEATLTWTSNLTGVTFTASTTQRSRWFGGKLVGPSYTPQTSSSIAMYCAGTVSAYALGPELHDVAIDLWRYYGVEMSFTSGAKVLNCRITNIGYSGVAGLSCSDMRVDGNYIGQIGTGAPAENAYGCFIDRREGTLAQYPLSVNCSMSFNIVEDIPTWHGLDTHGGQRFVFEGNIIYNCLRGIDVTSSDNGSNVETWAPNRCVIVGNTIQCNDNGNAISLNGAYNGSSTVAYAESCVIANNTIYNGGVDGGGQYEGAIRLRSTLGCKVVGNALQRPYAAGISVYFDNVSVDVSGNTITDVGDTTDNTVACIAIYGNNNTGNISNNTFNYSSAWSTYNSVRAINMSSGLTGCKLTFGPSNFSGIDANHLQISYGTASAVAGSTIYSENGSTNLSGGTCTTGFSSRFPSTPKVFVTNVNDLNPLRVSSVSDTQFTVTGTGTTSYNWSAIV